MISVPSPRLPLWVRRHWTVLTWTAIGLAAMLTIVLGIVGFQKNAAVQEPPAKYTFATLLYLACQLFLVNSGGVQGRVTWELDVARFAGGLVMLSTFLRLVATLFHDKWKDLRLRLYRDHVVVCGLDRKGRKLTEEFLLAGRRIGSARKAPSATEELIASEHLPVVVIDWDADNVHLKSMADLGAEVLVADAADEHTLRKAGVHRARYLVATGPNDETNIRIAAIAQKLAGELCSDREPLQCRIHIVNSRLFDMLMKADASSQRKCEIRVFNMFVNSVRLLFEDHFLDPGIIRADDRRTVHVVIIGLGQMGEALLIQVARMGQFANLRKPRVTVIDVEARRKQNLVFSRYPNLAFCCDVCFLDHDVHDPIVRQQIHEWAGDGEQVLSVAVCLDDDQRAMSCSLHLPKVLAQGNVPIYVRLSQPHGFRNLLKEQPAGAGCGFGSFGAPEDACTLDWVFRPGIEELAKASHADYLEEQGKQSVALGSKPSMRPWEALSEHYKNSNREQAEHIVWKLRAIGCRKVRREEFQGQSVTELTKEEIEILAKMEHLRWCAEKWLDGWLKGPEDEGKKTHPNLVPWEELSEEDRNKDRNPVSRICEQAAQVGLLD